MIKLKSYKNLSIQQPFVFLSTWFGLGLIRPAPGTWGTIGAIPFAYFALKVGNWPFVMLCAFFLFFIGLWAAKKFEEATKEHDSGSIVIDEVAGYFIAIIPASPTIIHLGIAFLLFRIFDILKPWPVSWADKKLTGALSVMLDDILAGLYAALIFGGLLYAGII
jgi:phosphatidylglycerophosphatase A